MYESHSFSSTGVIDEVPPAEAFLTWAAPGTCRTSTNATSAPHRAENGRDFIESILPSTSLYGVLDRSAYLRRSESIQQGMDVRKHEPSVAPPAPYRWMGSGLTGSRFIRFNGVGLLG